MPEESTPQYGKALIHWRTLEYQKHERSFTWYIVAGIFGSALLFYAILTASFPFAVIILMVGIILLLSHLKNPEQIDVYITTNGVAIGDKFYPYKEVKDFSIVYEPPRVKLLYLDFTSPLRPLLSVPLEDEDPNEVRETLVPYVLENLKRDSETLTDMLARLYKL